MTTAGKWRAFLASYEPPTRVVPGEIRFDHDWAERRGISSPCVLPLKLVEDSGATVEFSFENGLQAFLHAFVCMAKAVAIDWSDPDTGDADFTGDVGEVLMAMEVAARWQIREHPVFAEQGLIHPEFTPDNERLFGAWSF